jgi:hypothetical protein
MSYSTVLLEKSTGPQTGKKLPAFFGTECSLPYWQLHAVPSQSSSCLLIQFSIILPSTPMSSKCSLSLRCPHQKPAWTPVIHTCYMSLLSNYFWLAHPINISWRIYWHMSTAVPADAQCYVTQCYHYTADGYPEQEGCITSVNLQSYPIKLGKYQNKLFHN